MGGVPQGITEDRWGTKHTAHFLARLEVVLQKIDQLL